MVKPDNRPTTIRNLIDVIAGWFGNADLYYGHGTDNPDDEAYYLVMAALDLPFGHPETRLDQVLDTDVVSRILQMAQRRIEERIPVAYLVNRAWFCGLPFFVNEQVLVPRSPLGELIEEGFRPWVQPDRIKRILDIGTGSGCIAIACAFAFPDADVDAIDISDAALEVAHRNVKAHGLGGRVHPIKSDLYAALGDTRYDLIIANPPYVDARDMAELPPEFHHEPRIALAAGADGLDLVRRIIRESGRHMSSEAVLIVEVGNSQPAMEAAFPELPMLWLDFERGGEGVFLLHAQDLRPGLSG